MMTDLQFYHKMVDYLIDREEYRKYKESEAVTCSSYSDPYELIKGTEGKSFAEIMNAVSDALKGAPYFDEERYRSYHLLVDVLPYYRNLSIEEAFRFLFSLSDNQMMSRAVYEKISHYFGIYIDRSCERWDKQ